MIQDGREQYFNRATFALLDAQRSYTSHYSPKWRRLFIKIPHRALKARLAPTSQLTARACGTGAEWAASSPTMCGLLPPASAACR